MPTGDFIIVMLITGAFATFAVALAAASWYERSGAKKQAAQPHASTKQHHPAQSHTAKFPFTPVEVD